MLYPDFYASGNRSRSSRITLPPITARISASGEPAPSISSESKATGPFDSLSLVGHRQVMDAYLVALAQHQGGKLATLDRGVPDLIPNREARTEWVEVIPVEG